MKDLIQEIKAAGIIVVVLVIAILFVLMA